ncbi:MAG: TonB C-terminal domain-containing protein [Candidatus Aminicenantes bacterium]|nr:TonB C-terminal domain-containing protein [Candidatus Aminicenantes bacterium]
MKAPSPEDRPELLTRGLSLFVSLLIHAGMLYLLVTHFVSVRIIKFERPVTSVVIVPPPPLELPETARNPSNLPEVIEGFPEFLPSRTLPLKTAGPPPPVTSFEGSPTPAAVDAFEPRFTSGFRLDQSPPEKPGIISGDRLRLPIQERMIGSTSDLVRPAAPPPKDVDWRKYLSVGSGGLRGYLSGASSGRIRTRGSVRSGSTVSADIKKYNLSPWAGKVVELIQKNWDIPPTRPANPSAAVEITVVFAKSGQISALEVVSSSDDPTFNQSARFAVELSSPFPPLPEDFPAASLEVSFVFSVQ